MKKRKKPAGPTEVDEQEVQDFLNSMEDSLRQDVIPKIRTSAFVMGLLDDRGPDPYLLMQIGAAVLLDKPLLLIAVAGAWIPAKARQMADAVIDVANADEMKSEAKQEQLRAAVLRIIEQRRPRRA